MKHSDSRLHPRNIRYYRRIDKAKILKVVMRGVLICLFLSISLIAMFYVVFFKSIIMLYGENITRAYSIYIFIIY